jgi:hypothetical protein
MFILLYIWNGYILPWSEILVVVQEHKPVKIHIQQPVWPGGHGCLNNLSQVRLMNSTCLGGTTPLQVHMSNTGVDSLGVTNNSVMNMPIEKHPNAQRPPPKYVKIWEVSPPSQNRWCYGMRAGQTFLTLTRYLENTCNIYVSK